MVRQTANTSQGTRVMKESVFLQSDRLRFYALTVLGVFATIAFLLSWFRLDTWREYPVMFPILSVIIFLILGNAHGRWILLPQMRKPHTS